jgi:CHAD domain-containing protein
MNAAATGKIIRLRFRRLKRYYTSIGKEMGMEDIHHFRVEVKKLRAFLRMLQTASGHKLKIPGALKQMYGKAGAVRDLQLHRETIKERHDKHTTMPAPHLKHVSREITGAVKDLKKTMHPGLLRLARSKIEKKIPAGLSAAAIHDFYDQKLAAVRDIVSAGKFSDRQLHTIRKYLKDILYNAKTFETDLSCRYPVRVWNRKMEKYYTALTDELGKFQDSCVELKHFQNRQHQPGPWKKELVTALRREKQQIKDRLKQALSAKDTPIMLIP